MIDRLHIQDLDMLFPQCLDILFPQDLDTLLPLQGLDMLLPPTIYQLLTAMECSETIAADRVPLSGISFQSVRLLPLV